MNLLTPILSILVPAGILVGITILLKINYLDFWPRVITGIVGIFFMLIMHVYSIRKRKKDWGVFKKTELVSFLNWHIVTGTIGVTTIFFHALGSYDSIIAWVSFLAMFLVWQSGFVGRYLFVKIPKNEEGIIREKNLTVEKIEAMNQELFALMKNNNENEELKNFIVNFLGEYANSLHSLHTRNDGSIKRFFSNFMQILKAKNHYKKTLNAFSHATNLDTNLKSLKEDFSKDFVREYKGHMNSILWLHFQMEFYDVLKALFQNWHDIHVPLTYLFYTTAALHVIVISLFATGAK